jgi:predicted nuclease of restriction endonuclease-like (RecB) superfamily
MRLFFRAFPICDALRHELSWTHYRTLLGVEDEKARRWSMNEAADQGWSPGSPERQTGTLYDERLLASSDRQAVEQEAASKIEPLQQKPREFVCRPVILEFLGLNGAGKMFESELEQALLDNFRPPDIAPFYG